MAKANAISLKTSKKEKKNMNFRISWQKIDI